MTQSATWRVTRSAGTGNVGLALGCHCAIGASVCDERSANGRCIVVRLSLTAPERLFDRMAAEGVCPTFYFFSASVDRSDSSSSRTCECTVSN